MADIVTNFATIGAESTVKAIEATDRAIVKTTQSARAQSSVQSKQAQLLRQLRDAEREEQQQLRQSEGIINRAATAEQKHAKNVKALDVALRNKKITQAEYNRVVGESRTRLLGAGEANSSLVGGLKQTAIGIAGVGSAVGVFMLAARALRAEWNNLKEAQKTAGDKSIDFENALTETRFNVGKFLTADEQRALALSMATEHGIEPARAARLTGQTFTSTGIQDKQDVITASRSASAAAALRPDLADEDLGALGAAAGSLGKTFDLTPQQSIGFINKVGQQSNISELTKQVDNITPAIAGLMASGFTEGEAGSLLATITQKGFDTEGAKGFTGSVGFADSLRQAYRDDSRFTGEDGTFRAMDALQYLQQNPEQARTFMQGGKLDNGKNVGKARVGKGQLKPFFEQLLGILEGDTDDRFAAGVGVIGSFEEAGENYEELLKENQTNNVLSNLDRRLASTASAASVTDSAAVAGILRNRLPEIEKAFGATAFGQKVSGINRDFLSGSVGNPVGAIDTATTQLKELLTELDNDPSDRSQELARYLRPSVESLDSAAAVTRSKVAGDSLISASSTVHESGSLGVARSGIDEKLSRLVSPEHRQKIRSRFESALARYPNQDPRQVAQEITRNFELDSIKTRAFVGDRETFAESRVRDAMSGLSPEDQAAGLERFGYSAINAPQLSPAQRGAQFITEFGLDQSPAGAEALDLLRELVRLSGKLEQPFTPEVGTAPNPTVLLSGESGR